MLRRRRKCHCRRSRREVLPAAGTPVFARKKVETENNMFEAKIQGLG